VPLGGQLRVTFAGEDGTEMTCKCEVRYQVAVHFGKRKQDQAHREGHSRGIGLRIVSYELHDNTTLFGAGREPVMHRPPGDPTALWDRLQAQPPLAPASLPLPARSGSAPGARGHRPGASATRRQRLRNGRRGRHVSVPTPSMLQERLSGPASVRADPCRGDYWLKPSSM